MLINNLTLNFVNVIELEEGAESNTLFVSVGDEVNDKAVAHFCKLMDKYDPDDINGRKWSDLTLKEKKELYNRGGHTWFGKYGVIVNRPEVVLENSVAPAGFRWASDDELEPLDPNDAAFLKMTQGSTMSNTVLPSGATVPSGTWIVVGGVLKKSDASPPRSNLFDRNRW